MANGRGIFDIPAFKGPGIYAIVNRKKMRVYVGKAKDLNSRAKQHASGIEKGNHPNKNIQSDAGDKLDFLTLQVLPNNISDLEMGIIEKMYMISFKNSGFKLYNIQPHPDSIESSIIFDLECYYKTGSIISDVYMAKYNNHFCYDVLKSK